MNGPVGAAAVDNGWLARVLSRDRLACGVLDLARTLPADKWDAFARRVERVWTEEPADRGPRRAGASCRRR